MKRANQRVCATCKWLKISFSEGEEGGYFHKCALAGILVPVSETWNRSCLGWREKDD